jgi:hypothetical protein
MHRFARQPVVASSGLPRADGENGVRSILRQALPPEAARLSALAGPQDKMDLTPFSPHPRPANLCMQTRRLKSARSSE